MLVDPITPFQGFDVRYGRFLGRCPRLSHCAALRQTAPVTRSVPTEQNPDKSMPLVNPTFARRGTHATEFFLQLAVGN